jgi:hypothetical protein
MKAFLFVILSILSAIGLVLVAFGVLRLLGDFFCWIKKKMGL